MKVKAINKNTNQQFDCEEVEIDGYKYYLYYNTEPKKIGQYYITKDNQVDIVKTGKELGKPILCSNNPNIDVPKVVDEVERLAHKDNPLQKLDGEFLRASFKRGYKKSQETHPNSDEDMIEFGDWIRNNPCVWNYPDKLKDRRTTKELLQLWKEQQAKKVYYDK